MRKYLKAIPLSIAVSMAIGFTVLAAFTANILVTNTTTTAYTVIGINVTTNIEFMAANGYFSGVEGLDTRVNLGTAAQPHMLADDRLMFAIPVPANSSQTLSFTTGSSNLTAFNIIPGFGGNITVSDAANLELGDNFTLSVAGFFDTDNGTDKNIATKGGNFRIFVSPTVSGNITALIADFNDDFITDDWTDVGTLIGVNTTAQRLDYDAIRNAVDNRASVDVGLLSDTEWSLDFTFNNTAMSPDVLTYFSFGLQSLQENFSGRVGDAVLAQLFWDGANTAIRVLRWDGGATAVSGDIDIVDGTINYATLERITAINASISVYSDESRTIPLVGSPQSLVIPATIVNLRFINATNAADNLGPALSATGWIDTVFVNGGILTASGVDSGEHEVTLTANVSSFGLVIDGSLEDSESFTSVVDNTANWAFMQNNVMPYADNITISINGTQELFFAPITIISDIDGSSGNITDRAQSVNNWGVINWGGNPAGLNVVLGQLVSDFAVPTVDVTGTQDVVPSIGGISNPADAARLTCLMTDDPLFYPLFSAFNTVTSVPILSMYWMTFLLLAIILFFTIYRFVPNLLIASIGFDGVIGFAVGWPTCGGIYDFWVIAVLVIFTAGMALLEGRSPA